MGNKGSTVSEPNFDDWAEYYQDRKNGVRRPPQRMTAQELEDAQLAQLEERERIARARIEAERAKRPRPGIDPPPMPRQ
jgi:hypothetical protein